MPRMATGVADTMRAAGIDPWLATTVTGYTALDARVTALETAVQVAAWPQHYQGKTVEVKFRADQWSDPTPFNARGGSAPAGFVAAGCPQEFLNVRLQQAEPNVPVKLLAPLV